MEFHIFSSGSAGNCTLIKSGSTHILIDVGISNRQIEKHLKNLSLTLDDIDAILITHNHGDHIQAVSKLPKEKVYGSNKTVSAFNLPYFNEVEQFVSVKFKDLNVTPIPLSHDEFCLGFILTDSVDKLVYVTDTGYINNKLHQYLKDATYYIFESNHDVEMLMETSRPSYLKTRIISDNGHLNNFDSSYLLTQFITKRTKEIVFAHISREANTYDLPIEVFSKVADEEGIDVASLILKCAKQEEVVYGGELTLNAVVK